MKDNLFQKEIEPMLKEKINDMESKVMKLLELARDFGTAYTTKLEARTTENELAGIIIKSSDSAVSNRLLAAYEEIMGEERNDSKWGGKQTTYIDPDSGEEITKEEAYGRTKLGSRERGVDSQQAEA